MRFFLSVALLTGFGALLLPGCGDDGTTTPMIEPSTLFGECTVDEECPGEGAVCMTEADGFPMGYCTIPCEDRTVCFETLTADLEVHNHCIDRDGDGVKMCERACSNGLDCGRNDYTCVGEVPPTGLGVCNPVCSPGGCGDAICNRDSGECVTEEPTGAGVGEPCTSNDACRSGTCNEEDPDTGAWAGGYCLGNCILPSGYNGNSFYDGDGDGVTDTELPQGGCSDGAVCFPNGTLDAGDFGVCVDGCRNDGDCRTGYGCRLQFQDGGPTFQLGFCAPAG